MSQASRPTRPGPAAGAPGAGVPRAKGTPEEAVLDLDGLAVVRDGRALLDDVSWAVGADERWVVLGPNGAGKTTLLQVAAARVFPTRGRAEVLGEELGAVDVFELRPRIGLASAALAERVPAGERVVDVVLTAAYGMVGRWREEYEGPDHERALELLAALGVGGLDRRAYGTLSEGERKRVQVARALMSDPELVLLDEPAAGLDLGGREDLVRRLATLVGDEAAPAVVLVTHHVEEIPPGITHGLLLRDGRVVGQGPLADVLTPAALGETYGLRLRVEHSGGRWAARAA